MRVAVPRLPARHRRPPGADPARALLYLHGGGYALGSAKAYRPFTARVAHEFGGPTVVINYRLAPEHPFPAGLEDAVAAIRALSAERGGDGVILQYVIQGVARRQEAGVAYREPSLGPV